MQSKSNLAFLEVVWQWKFGLGSLGFLGTFYVAWQLILEPMMTYGVKSSY